MLCELVRLSKTEGKRCRLLEFCRLRVGVLIAVAELILWFSGPGGSSEKIVWQFVAVVN